MESEMLFAISVISLLIIIWGCGKFFRSEKTVDSQDHSKQSPSWWISILVEFW